MTLDGIIERWSRGWRGPALAALIAFLAGLPGVFAVPPLDRDESRFAQATAQMLETGDFVVIRFQNEPRFKKPVGIYWLQAGSVALLSEAEARDIWAYRIPSLLGAMLAAAACAWGAAVFFGGPAGLLAGATLASTFLLSSEAFIAKTDAVLCGTTTLAVAALARIYAG
ncbi:MAG: glycosyltransferase family 39 protein, partial [Phenylobacterium sp.]|nr:glycosyltransferase family 39 protein [Phenylobacterium sp.]